MSPTERDPVVLFAREHLSTAALSDGMDSLGLIHQIMTRSVRPLDEGLVLCGRARTGNYSDVYHHPGGPDPYEPQVALVDSLRPDDVMVLACGASGRIQPWGEIFTVAAQTRGCAGCVTDGLMRDVNRIRLLGFPAFCSGYGAIEVRGRGILVAADVPVLCGGVWVTPGDLVFGDADGIAVVPRDAEEEVIRQACEMGDRERDILRALRDGRTLAKVYKRFGRI